MRGRPSQSLTLKQAAALLEAAEASRLHAFIVLCLLTGVRSEEARALTWERVALEAGELLQVPAGEELAPRPNSRYGLSGMLASLSAVV